MSGGAVAQIEVRTGKRTGRVLLVYISRKISSFVESQKVNAAHEPCGVVFATDIIKKNMVAGETH